MLTNKSSEQTSPQAALQKSRAYLLASGNNGSWSYHPSGAPAIEATAWCSLALRNDETVRRQSINYLLQSQNSDGGWSSEPGLGPSDWNSALALLALRLLSDTETASSKTHEGEKVHDGIEFLLEHKTEYWNRWASIIVGILKGWDFLKYPQGWPWTWNAFHWIEPTSYSLLALKPLSDKDMEESISRANYFLLDRHCVDGGWNHGENKSIHFYSKPYPVTTAQALCALQDMHDQPSVQGGLSYLNKIAGEQSTVMGLAWAILARDLHGEDVSAQRKKLLELQQPDGSFGPTLHLTALAICALDETGNILRFSPKS